MLEKNNKVTQLGKSNSRMLVNSIYGSVGSDNVWQDMYRKYRKYFRNKNRKKKIKNILND